MNKLIFILLSFVGSIPLLSAQTGTTFQVTVSGIIKEKITGDLFPYVNVVLKTSKDSIFVTGTVSNEVGRFVLTDLKPNEYLLEAFFPGYKIKKQTIFVGKLSPYLEIPPIELEEEGTSLDEVIISAEKSSINAKMNMKTYQVDDNISRIGGSVLQTMQNLPGVTVQDGKIQLRGSDKITVLIDGKQTALTGFGNQSGLDHIPASAIEKIEIINNPSSKYDANGQAGIINIVMKKERQEGWSGKITLTTGLGSLWERKPNLPTIRPQYRLTPKINPSISLNYSEKKINIFLQIDDLYTETLNKNEYVSRIYDDGTKIHSQLKRNRNTNFLNSKTGFDWNINEQNALTISTLFGSEKIIDRGDEPFFNAENMDRLRLWQFLEDELKTTAMVTGDFRHKFKQPGHLLRVGFNYTFHREDEKYFYDNSLPNSKGTDAFKLLSDEHVYDFNIDYNKPLKSGKIEIGAKLRNRLIPTNMHFIPGLYSVLDSLSGGWAAYKELIPAVYGNYVFETKKWEAELGIRLEYVRIQYDVNPNHPTYRSDGYDYFQPFPNLRLTYKITDRNKLSVFYHRRVDRPNEVDIRIFPKYDDAEIIKVGNPALRPQFTHSIELGNKFSWNRGSLFNALYYRYANGTITRISTIVPGSTLVYAIFQNAGESSNIGLETIWEQTYSSFYSLSINGNIYHNRINAFTVENRYPQPHPFSAGKQDIVSGNIKMNNIFHFAKGYHAQLTVIYLAPDIISQGKTNARFSLDMGIKKTIKKGEFFFNATDLLNTLVIRKIIQGNGFHYVSTDYYETQVIRIGFSFKF